MGAEAVEEDGFGIFDVVVLGENFCEFGLGHWSSPWVRHFYHLGGHSDAVAGHASVGGWFYELLPREEAVFHELLRSDADFVAHRVSPWRLRCTTANKCRMCWYVRRF